MKVTFTGFPPLRKRVEDLLAKIKSFPGLFNMLAGSEIQDAQKRIQVTKRNPEGKQWKSWEPSTRRAREREGTAATGLLYRTGALHDSFETEINNKGFTILNRQPYAQFLQEGTATMYPRQFLGWSKQSRERISKITKSHFGLK